MDFGNLLLGFLIIVCLGGLATIVIALWCQRKSSVIRVPVEWVESGYDIEVIGRSRPSWGPSDTWPKCTKENPWDGKTLPVLHVDGDFLEDFNDLLRCPNCGHQWSIGPDV